MQTTLAIPEKMRKGFLKRVLDPIDRLTEAIYAILIVMTFTLAAFGVALVLIAIPLGG